MAHVSYPNESAEYREARNALWGLLDMTPEGRGGTFFPKVYYD